MVVDLCQYQSNFVQEKNMFILKCIKVSKVIHKIDFCVGVQCYTIYSVKGLPLAIGHNSEYK